MVSASDVSFPKTGAVTEQPLLSVTPVWFPLISVEVHGCGQGENLTPGKVDCERETEGLFGLNCMNDLLK